MAAAEGAYRYNITSNKEVLRRVGEAGHRVEVKEGQVLLSRNRICSTVDDSSNGRMNVGVLRA